MWQHDTLISIFHIYISIESERWGKLAAHRQRLIKQKYYLFVCKELDRREKKTPRDERTMREDNSIDEDEDLAFELWNMWLLKNNGDADMNQI